MNDKLQLNPWIEGYLIVAIKKIRRVEFIELLNYPNENRYDEDIEFYISMIGHEIYEKELNIHRAERIRKLAPYYIKYKVFYSLVDSNILQLLNKQNEHDDNRPYNYVLVSYCENIVIEYERLLAEFRRYKIKKTFVDGYCRLRDLDRILEVHKADGKELINSI